VYYDADRERSIYGIDSIIRLFSYFSTRMFSTKPSAGKQEHSMGEVEDESHAVQGLYPMSASIRASSFLA
jgi:hypothetical protein